MSFPCLFKLQVHMLQLSPTVKYLSFLLVLIANVLCSLCPSTMLPFFYHPHSQLHTLLGLQMTFVLRLLFLTSPWIIARESSVGKSECCSANNLGLLQSCRMLPICLVDGLAKLVGVFPCTSQLKN
jgi:hypothetical protein